MKLKFFSGLCAALLLGTVSCTEEKFDLPGVDISPEQLAEGVGYTVEHDSENPNIVYLTSLLPSNYNVAWETPQGRIVASQAVMKIPFEGEYEFRMAVQSRGGYVWSDYGKFTIDDFCADFVSHYLWKRLTGGVGESKIWQVDLAFDADGNQKTTRFRGPHWFWNINYTWDKLHAEAENESVYKNFLDSDPWDPADAIDPEPTGVDALDAESNWYWNADYAGNPWMCNAQNYGYMELNLIGNANCILYDADMNEIGRGTFLIDTDNHTIGFSDVYPLWTTNDPPSGNGSKSFNLLYLSDDAMIMFAPGHNTGINYVTKKYFDAYVPPVANGGPQIPLYEDLESLLFTITGEDASYVSTKTTYTLDPERPMDIYFWDESIVKEDENKNLVAGAWVWENKYGTEIPAFDTSDFALTLTKKSRKVNNVLTPYFVADLSNGKNSKSCEFTIGDKILTFDERMTFINSGDYQIRPENRELTVLSVDERKGIIILGTPYSTNGNGVADRYLAMTVNVKPLSTGSGETTLDTKYFDFNPEKVNFYNDGEYARISLNNPWGDPADNALDCDPISWNKTFSITFRLSGTPAGFSGQAGLSLNKNDWSIVLWAPDNLSTNINGDGVYTVTYSDEAFAPGDLMMCAVEISNLDANTPGLEAEVLSIAADVNGTQWPWKPENVNFYNEGDYARISMNNPWGDPNDDAIDCAPINWNKTFSVTFRLTGTPAGFSGQAGLSLNKNDWSIVLWAPDNLSTNLDGDGIYTVTYTDQPFAAGDLMMFAVEISNLDANTEGLKAEVIDIRTW